MSSQENQEDKPEKSNVPLQKQLKSKLSKVHSHQRQIRRPCRSGTCLPRRSSTRKSRRPSTRRFHR